MLGAPMLWHASAHLELIYLGAFPLFLWTWLRLFDQPSRGRLSAAVGGFVLAAFCAAYYAVYAVFPRRAVFLLEGVNSRAWRGLAVVPRPGSWLVAFSVLVIPCLLIVFGNHIWAMAQGYALPRAFADFRNFGAPLWSYACPSWQHALGRSFPSSWWTTSGYAPKIGECCSYLGVVSLLLVAYSAAFHVRFRDASYWWACLVLIVVLSGGLLDDLSGTRSPCRASGSSGTSSCSG